MLAKGSVQSLQAQLQSAEALVGRLIFMEMIDTPGFKVLDLAKDDLALVPPLIGIHLLSTLGSNMIHVLSVGDRSRPQGRLRKAFATRIQSGWNASEHLAPTARQKAILPRLAANWRREPRVLPGGGNRMAQAA